MQLQPSEGKWTFQSLDMSTKMEAGWEGPVGREGRSSRKDGKGQLEALAPANQKSPDQDFLLEGAG